MKKAILFCALLWFAPDLCGQNMPKTILWKVTKGKSKKESFLFGTFHEVSPSFFQSLPEAVSRLEQSDVLFVEERMGQSGKSPTGNQPLWNSSKWKDLLTDEQEQLFASFVQKAEDTSYYTLNPLVLTLTVSRLYLLNFCASDAAFAQLMDHHIEQLAIGQNKQIYSLDTSQHLLLSHTAARFDTRQDSVFASNSIRFMQHMLQNDLSGCELVHAYQRLDINYELDKDLSGDPASTALLVERNRKWIQTLDNAFSSGNCFVAVGLKHLFYKQGLIQQLRALGYTVRPVPLNREGSQEKTKSSRP